VLGVFILRYLAVWAITLVLGVPAQRELLVPVLKF